MYLFPAYYFIPHWFCTGYYPHYAPHYNYYYHPFHYQISTQSSMHVAPINASSRPFPEVNPSKFISSASECQTLIENIVPIVERIANSKDFAKQLMSAAQESDHEKVDRLIRESGGQARIETEFNPDGIRLEFTKEDGEQCRLLLMMKW